MNRFMALVLLVVPLLGCRTAGHFAMKLRSKRRSVLTAVFGALLLPACQTPAHPPLQMASSVDIPKFMGDWYVIGNIPARIERDAYNAGESYRLDEDGRVLTTFTGNVRG
jgi:lipocalin